MARPLSIEYRGPVMGGLIQHDVTARDEIQPVTALEKKPVAPVNIVPPTIVETRVTATSRDSITGGIPSGYFKLITK